MAGGPQRTTTPAAPAVRRKGRNSLLQGAAPSWGWGGSDQPRPGARSPRPAGTEKSLPGRPEVQGTPDNWKESPRAGAGARGQTRPRQAQEREAPRASASWVLLPLSPAELRSIGIFKRECPCPHGSPVTTAKERRQPKRLVVTNGGGKRGLCRRWDAA